MVDETWGKPERQNEAVAVLDSSLTYVQFPTTREGVVEQVGNVGIPIGPEGRSIPLGVLLSALPQRQFNNQGEVTAAVLLNWDELASAFR